MANEKLAKSKQTGGAHHALAALVGEWTGSTKTWFEPEKLADEAPMRGTIRLVLDGRFAVYEYEGTLSGTPQLGIAMIGYHIDAGEYTAAWADSCHMGTDIMLCTGPRTERGCAVLGHYDAPEGPPWGWRTEIDAVDADNLVITVYNIMPNGEEAKAVETRYERASA